MTRPLHLFGSHAEAIAPFITRLGVPVTTDAPTTADAPQLHCHSWRRGNQITDGGNLWMARARAPEGLLGSWGVELEGSLGSYGEQYEPLIKESFPSAHTGAGAAGLIRLLELMGHHPILTLDVIIPPHPEPDPVPTSPESWIRHTTALPSVMTEATPRTHIFFDSQHAEHIFWQMTPDLRDEWLAHPHATELLVALCGHSPDPVPAMIWHRGADTTAAIRAHFTATPDLDIRKAYLRGVVHWGTPEELHATHELRAHVEGIGGDGRFGLRHLGDTLSEVLSGGPYTRDRAQGNGELAMVRLIERDLAFRTTLLEAIDPDSRAAILLEVAQSVLDRLGEPVVAYPPHPIRTGSTAYLSRQPLRKHGGREEKSFHLPEGGVVHERDEILEALARLTEAAAMVRGGVWRENTTAIGLHEVIKNWGKRATAADDFAVGDWLQSYRGPTGLLGRVANGVLQWSTLSPVTLAGIARARNLSRAVNTELPQEVLMRRVPTEQIPAEWLAIAADQGNNVRRRR